MEAWLHHEVRRLRSEGWTIKAIALKFGVSTGSVSRACNGIECPVNHVALSQRRRFNKGRRMLNLIKNESAEDLPNG
jgi:DNA-binding LacI/PurR family transcriptional regulator